MRESQTVSRRASLKASAVATALGAGAWLLGPRLLFSQEEDEGPNDTPLEGQWKPTTLEPTR